MPTQTSRNETRVAMRFSKADVAIIDRAADLSGVSRTEFVRRASLCQAQSAILNERVIRLSSEAFGDFVLQSAPRLPRARPRWSSD
jgi:uncharacterized protein (DUF1778 family)